MPLSLMEMLEQVPDPRSTHGRVHALVPMLSLAVVAILAGHTTLEAIAQFGRDHGPSLAHALGFTRGKTPCKATFSRLFCRLDEVLFEAILAAWIAQRCPDLGDHFCLDGKGVNGSHDGEVPATHLLALYAPKVDAVVQQLRVDSKTNEHKAALRLLGMLPLKGKTITGDAMFCQTEVTQTIVEQEGDYLLQVKDNQPTVHARIADFFDAPASFSPHVSA